MLNKVNPCTCGSTYISIWQDRINNYYFICCASCLKKCRGYETKEDLINAWNNMNPKKLLTNTRKCGIIRYKIKEKQDV